MRSTLPMNVVWRYAAGMILTQLPYSMVVPLVAVRMSEEGIGSFAVGVYAMLTFLPILVLTPTVPSLCARVGLPFAFRLGMMLCTVAFVGTVLSSTYFLWCIFSTLIGVGASILWSVADSLVARNAPEDSVGWITGLYQTLLGVAFATGPFVTPVLGLSFEEARFVAISFSLIMWTPILALPPGTQEDKFEGNYSSFMTALTVSPAFVIAGFVGGVYEIGLNAVSTVQAIHFGIATSVAPAVAGTIAIGSLLVQFPLGWLADRVAPKPLLIASMIILFLASVALPFAGLYTPFFWIISALWGAAGGGLYTLVMVRVGVEQRSTAASATAGVIAGYTAGCMVGPVLGGAALDFSPTYGLAVLLGSLTLVGLAASVRNVTHSAPVPEDEKPII